VAKSYRDLTVWNRAMTLAESTYELTGSFPEREQYRLTSQLIRAAISIPANIAEGQRRATRKDYARFISIARGSTAEVETLLELALRVGMGRADEVEAAFELAEEVSRMLNVLLYKLNK